MKILQLVDADNLCVSGSSIDRTFFSLFSEFEDLVGNLIVGFLVVSFFEKLFLEFLQSLVDLISGILLSTADHLCNVLLELRLVGGLITKERVDSLNYHILQYRLIDGSCVAFLPGRFQSTDAAPDDGFAEYSIATDPADAKAVWIFYRLQKQSDPLLPGERGVKGHTAHIRQGLGSHCADVNAFHLFQFLCR